eukprot:4758124-Prymnesium_polylepis.1
MASIYRPTGFGRSGLNARPRAKTRDDTAVDVQLQASAAVAAQQSYDSARAWVRTFTHSACGGR